MSTANLNDVQRIVLSLPETTMDDDRIAFSVNNKGNGKEIAWVWMERVHPKQARVPNLSVLAIRVRDLAEKEMLLAACPDTLFTEPHYNGFPAVLVRLAAINVDMCRTLVPKLVQLSPDAMFLLVTNPVDVVTYAAVQAFGLPGRRVFGSGTVLDSSRLRTLLAQHCSVAVHSVDAFIVGEHGDSQVSAWSQASIGGVPVRQWTVPGRPPLDGPTLDHIAHEVVTAAEQIIRGKGATNYAVGLATAGIIEAVLHDERSVLPVSSLLTGQYGVDDVCLSLPSVVDGQGVDAVLSPPLTGEEVDALRRSADAVRGVERSLGL